MDIRKLICGTEIALPQMLKAREERKSIQEELLKKHASPLISFSLNIAGPVKVFPLAEKTFEEGLELIRTQCRVYGIRISEEKTVREATGNEAFFCAEGDALLIKKVLSKLEESHSLGRLFDIDVLLPDGSKITRTEIGFPERTCLLCGRPAFVCSRSRAHSVPELQERTCLLMWDYFSEKYAKDLSSIAVRALLYEVMATPKPGLVDRNNNGAHTDMDIFTFETSALAILPYFTAFVNEGIRSADRAPEELLSRIRPIGIDAETAMFRATGGVNTHKGAIFSMGLACAALGFLYGSGKEYSREETERILKRSCGSLMKELQDIPEGRLKTNGERLYRDYGIRGIRGEAADGFPTVFRTALPGLCQLLKKGYTLNDAGVITLVYILAAADDTNIVSRSSVRTMQEIRKRAAALIAEGFEKEDYIGILKDLDRKFIEKNISPGGSADLLAMTYFFYFIETGKVPTNLNKI